MKLKLLVSLSNGKQPGDAHECDEAEAGRMIASRFAVPWSDPIETTAKAPAVETRAPTPAKAWRGK